jgi:hypothetical protein
LSEIILSRWPGFAGWRDLRSGEMNMRQIAKIAFRTCVSLVVLVSLGQSIQQRAQAQTDPCVWPSQNVGTPLNDLGNQEYIRMDGTHTGFFGGLYPGGSNVRPPAHELAGVDFARHIVPRDQNGIPDAAGKIVMIGIGMSNAFQEFNAFLNVANGDTDVNPDLVIVNGAQPGRTAEQWIDPNADAWTVVNNRLGNVGLTPEQVQVAWVKNTLTGGGDFPALAQALQLDFEIIARNLKIHYPNIQIAYFSSRTNSYTYWTGLSPEPNAFETGFSVKWMIEKQINGDASLNYNPVLGPVVAPFLSWGPYLWANGPNPRSDALVWLQSDMVLDCTHPSASGEAKVAQMMMNFFKHDSTTGWFLATRPAEWSIFLPLIINFINTLVP